jgi:hypothetical protein
MRVHCVRLAIADGPTGRTERWIADGEPARRYRRRGIDHEREGTRKGQARAPGTGDRYLHAAWPCCEEMERRRLDKLPPDSRFR